jgi:hypothetical protein
MMMILFNLPVTVIIIESDIDIIQFTTVTYSSIQETNKYVNKAGEKAREQVPYQSAEESPISKAY